MGFGIWIARRLTAATGTPGPRRRGRRDPDDSQAPAELSIWSSVLY